MVFVTGIPTLTTEAQFRSAVEIKNLEGYQSCTLIRKNPSPESSSTLVQDMVLFNSLWTACGDVESITSFPVNKNGAGKAYIRFKSSESVLEVVKAYHNKLVDLFGNDSHVALDVKADLSVTFNIASEMYPKLKYLLQEETRRIKGLGAGVKVSGPVEKGLKGATIKIEADEYRVLTLAKIGLESLLAGEMLNTDLSETALLLHAIGKKHLANLQAELAHVYIAWNRRGVRLFGCAEEREKAKANIFAYLDERKIGVNYMMRLEPKLVCSVAAGRSGTEALSRVEEETGARRIAVDWRSHILTINGSEASVEAAKIAINALVDESKSNIRETNVKAEEEELCMFCYTNGPDYTLQLCGHRLCRQCMGRILELNSKPALELHFPIKCPFSDRCDELIALQDVESCVPSAAILQGICEQSALQFVAHNQDRYGFCPGVNCTQILALDSCFASCSKCCGQFCLACKDKDGTKGVPWHEGLTCVEFQALQRDGGHELLQTWMKEKGIKLCNICGMAVEKNGGCDHMRCRCGFNFCYQCDKPSFNISCRKPC